MWLSFRLGAVLAATGLLGGGLATAAAGIELPISPLSVELVAEPTPKPTSARERTPLSLRLANWIRTDDGSLPAAAKEVAIEIDRHFHLDLAGVPRCRVGSDQADPPFDWSRCEKSRVAFGQIRFAGVRPDREPFRIGANLTAYKRSARELTLLGFVPSPADGEVTISVRIGRTPRGAYGSRLVASIPEVAAGDVSLVYLGLRFRKGLFSATCPDGRSQFRVDDSFVDGTRLGGTVLSLC